MDDSRRHYFVVRAGCVHTLPHDECALDPTWSNDDVMRYLSLLARVAVARGCSTDALPRHTRSLIAVAVLRAKWPALRWPQHVEAAVDALLPRV